MTSILLTHVMCLLYGLAEALPRVFISRRQVEETVFIQYTMFFRQKATRQSMHSQCLCNHFCSLLKLGLMVCKCNRKRMDNPSKIGSRIFGKVKCSCLKTLRNKIGQHPFPVLQGLSLLKLQWPLKYFWEPKVLSNYKIHHGVHINWEKWHFVEAEPLTFLLLEGSYHPSLLPSSPLSCFSSGRPCYLGLSAISYSDLYYH